MGTYGRQKLGDTGIPIQVQADGNPRWKTGGITLDWSTVTAMAADTEFDDKVVVGIGQKGLRFGQVLCRIGVKEVQTITINATGGTFTISYDGQTTAPIAWNATAAAVQSALEALSNINPGDVAVSLNALVYTITWKAALGNVSQFTTNAASLTGGTQSAAVATTTAGVAGGKWGPYDPAATDGRQLLTRGNVVILNATTLEKGKLGLGGAGATDHPGVIEGGRVWRARILASEGATSLALGPTFSALEAALPELSYAQN